MKSDEGKRLREKYSDSYGYIGKHSGLSMDEQSLKHCAYVYSTLTFEVSQFKLSKN